MRCAKTRRQPSAPHAITNGSREAANKKLLAGTANLAALATSQTVAQTDSVHVCQIPLADMAELADMTAKAVGREFSRIQNAINPRTSAESAKIRVPFFAFPTSVARTGAFAASRDAGRRCWSSQ